MRWRLATRCYKERSVTMSRSSGGRSCDSLPASRISRWSRRTRRCRRRSRRERSRFWWLGQLQEDYERDWSVPEFRRELPPSDGILPTLSWRRTLHDGVFRDAGRTAETDAASQGQAGAREPREGIAAADGFRHDARHGV